MRQITFKVPGKPTGKGRPRFTRNGRAYTPNKTRAYESLVARVAKIAMAGEPVLTGPVRLQIEACFAKPKSWAKKKREAAYWKTSIPDADNLAKVADALNGIVWKDDAQVCELSVKKVYSVHDVEEMMFIVTELTA
jgi:Holliday junction resolvase RusA-like endonuclease